MKNKPFLIVSESEHNSDMYYVTHFLAGDIFFYLSIPEEDRDILISWGMEYNRANKESITKDVYSIHDYERVDTIEEYILQILEREQIKEIEVPKSFSLYTAEKLMEMGIEVTVAESSVITKNRETKNKEEVEFIKKAQRVNEKAMEVATSHIENASVSNDCLMEDGKPLTSEKIRAYIEHFFIDSGCSSDIGGIIVASGKEASNPHSIGSGVIHTNESIIIDIAPQLNKERYYADMTRTVARGEPSKEIEEMYDAVLHAQENVISFVKEGVTCDEVHSLTCDIFEEFGYGTNRTQSKKGFIHSTGHGVGLDVHENPNVTFVDYELRKGNVITIEPGLYDHEIGGVRLEDMVLVLKDGCQNLTNFKKELRI